MTLTLRRTNIHGEILSDDYMVRYEGRNVGWIYLRVGHMVGEPWFWTTWLIMAFGERGMGQVSRQHARASTRHDSGEK